MSELRVPDLNKTLIAGRLCADPEINRTASGKEVANIRIANTRYYKKVNGEKGEETVFISGAVWDKQAEWAGENLKKGHAVLLEGSLKEEKWEDKTSGQQRSKIVMGIQRLTPLEWHGSKPVEKKPAERPVEEPAPGGDIPF